MVVSNGETQLDYFALGLAVYPTSLADYYAQQQQANQGSEFSFTMPEADEDGDVQINLDDQFGQHFDYEDNDEQQAAEKVDDEL